MIDGVLHTLPPAERSAWDRAIPVYDTLPGWNCDTTACTRYEDLPAAAKAYLTRLAELCGAPITFVGVGPDRVQTLTV
jgi:adenylosuccinate synthase